MKRAHGGGKCSKADKNKLPREKNGYFIAKHFMRPLGAFRMITVDR
jgi:hypothetical protein